MTGSLKHLGGDVWKVRVYAGKDLNGKQRQRSRNFTAPNLQKARKIAGRISAELDREIRDGVARRDTIAGLAEQWMKLKRDRGKSPSTLVNYQRQANRIVEHFGTMKVTEVTGRHIDGWYAELRRKGMSDANILHHHATLRNILRQGERWEMVANVATRRATPPDRVKPVLEMPTTAVVDLLVSSATGDLRVALFVAAATGCRRGEIVGLQWGDLHDGDLIVSRSILEVSGRPWLVKTTKGKRERRVELDAFTLAELEAHRARIAAQADQLGARMPPWIFPSFRADPTGRTPKMPGWLSHEWMKLRDRHGAPGVRLHSLRHWHASVLMAAGINPVEVSKRLGHAQTSTTLDIYGHLQPGEKGQSAAVIGGLLPTRAIGSGQ